ncbi:helix-turn-helix domain-containing protein [Siccirubricoccus sp. G192]|uniref:helix-turn-helix domain-containing protein n=1 Tax=Siccirubricoccus sp. G192 TaxID=2849651 RepID=UPI001C2C04DA|nr:helix-turn-helix domain-containing protein [Siccirubricoccus sp. G192]MBV1796278.1 helix-turn-helix domain-containing protein [Siccirubricoccus sp. G192]
MEPDAPLDLPRLGAQLRAARQARAAADPRQFSVRALAARLKVSAAYLSLLERGSQRPTEALLRALAAELDLPPEPLLALARRVPEDVAAAVAARPALAEAVRALRDLPDAALDRAIRRIRDGDW